MERLEQSEVPLIDRATAHAAAHPKSAAIIAELIARVDACHRTIRRVTSDTWADDLDG